MKVIFRKASYLYSVILLILIVGCNENKNEMKISVIPKPNNVEFKNGKFILDKETKIIVDSSNFELREIADYFSKQLNLVSGYSIKTIQSNKNINLSNSIQFTSLNIDKTLEEEGYTLVVNPKNIVLSGNPHGIFNGVQTLFQLLPEAIYSSKLAKQINWQIPSVNIVDKPRFKWRGMHLDVGRHMFSVEFIKKYIDYLALHKLNTFHWHLTEDQGWRIEIKKYPKLNTIGAWRKGTTSAELNMPDVLDGIRYGGFYTQEEIKEVVEYAKKRFITIVPEIELPGHSLAALAAYPELSCTGGPFEVRTKWAVEENIYCAGNEKVFTFLQNVLSEVMEMFPSEYIHIGGDEAPKIRWEKCPKCQKRIKAENLKDEHELQSYFISRIDKFLNSKGRKLIGWDEILEGGLAQNAAVMSWRGIKGGIEAARLKHNVVMSPSTHCYFDHYQGIPENEPRAFGGYTSLEKVYSYEPIPEELNKAEQKYILGVQANVWTEYIKTADKVEYMAMPRMCALAEVAWSLKRQRNFNDFLNRMDTHYLRLDEIGTNYRKPSLRNYKRKVVFINDAEIDIISGRKGVKLYYTLDGSEVTTKSNQYTKPFTISESAELNILEVSANGKSNNKFSTSYVKQKPIKSSNKSKKNSGIKFDYFALEKSILQTNELTELNPTTQGIIEKITFPLEENRLTESFGVIFTGYVEVSKRDIYTFSLMSNDGSKLYIADNLIIENDGWHGEFEKEGEIALMPGFHKIKLFYFQAGGAKALRLSMRNSGSEKKEISNDKLSY